MNRFALLLASALPVFASAQPVVEPPLGILIQVRPGMMEAALRKIERADLKAISAAGDVVKCQAKPSRVQFAEQLRNEPEFAGVWIDQPCERFVVEWRRGENEVAIEFLTTYGAKILHRGETLPFAVCEGPLTAEIQQLVAVASCIETVEAEAK